MISLVYLVAGLALIGLGLSGLFLAGGDDNDRSQDP